MNSEPVTVNKIIMESNMIFKDTPVLNYKIEYPRFLHPIYQNELNEINEFYRRQAEDLQRKYETEYYQNAVDLYEYSMANQFPFHMYEALSTYVVTFNQNNLLSLYYDHYSYTGGAHGSTERRSDTWNIKTGCRISLFQFTNDAAAFQAEILNNIRKQITLHMEKGENWYFDDYPQLIYKYFDPGSFYLTPDGIVIYYQQYEIAPYSSGITEFNISGN
jgi:hypothetical protein